MTKRLDVPAAVKAMIIDAMPGTDVVGLDPAEDLPARIGAAGRVIVRAGDRGEPAEVTLSPVTYWWEHPIPVTLARGAQPGQTDEEALDELLALLDAAILSNRTLGGLVDYLDATPGDSEVIQPFDDRGQAIGAAVRSTEITITASYSTSGPLA